MSLMFTLLVTSLVCVWIRVACIKSTFNHSDIVQCSGPSMQPTLNQDNILLTERISVSRCNIKRWAATFTSVVLLTVMFVTWTTFTRFSDVLKFLVRKSCTCVTVHTAQSNVLVYHVYLFLFILSEMLNFKE